MNLPVIGKYKLAMPTRTAPIHPSVPFGYVNMKNKIPLRPEAARRAGTHPKARRLTITNPMEPIGNPTYRGMRPMDPWEQP